NQRHLTDWALLAIGNLGPDWATQAVTSVAASTVEAARHSTGRRLLAVAALQNMQPSALAVSALERLLMSGALISSSDGRRLQAAIVRALLPRLEKGTCPTNRNCPTSLSTAIERLWNSSNPADAALATYAHSVARKRLEKLESSLSQDSALKSDAALRQLRQLVEKPPALFSIDRASKPSVRADRFQLVDGLIDISYEIDWESADAVIISMPTRAEFQLTLHNQMTGFAVPLLDAELIRRFSNGPGDHTAVIRRRGDVTVAVDWTGESSIGDLQRLLWDDTWMSATIESVLMPTTLQALLISSEAALIANSGVSRRPPSVTESFRTDGSVMLQPSFSVYASRSVHLSGLSMGRRSSRSSVIHRLGISGDGDLSVELFWRWQTSDGWGLSVGLRSPLQRQELLRVRLMSVLAEGKNDAKNPVFNDTWISENQDDISSRQSWQLCMRAFSRTITGHNICASVKKQRQWSKFSLILERQDPKAELFEATLEKKTTETMSETKIVFGNRNSPQRHFGLTINSLNTSEGSFLKFDASNPVFPVSLNSSLQAGGGIAAAQLLAGSQSYSFLGNWSRNSSDWRLTGDVSRVDRSWQRFGLDLVSDAVSGTDQLTPAYQQFRWRLWKPHFGSNFLRLRASDFEAAVSARLTESGSNETASARFGISGGRVSNGSSDKLVFVQSTEARQLGVGWMRHRLETSIDNCSSFHGVNRNCRWRISSGATGKLQPRCSVYSFSSGMRIYKETDGIAFNIKHYWPALTSLNQSLRLTIDTQRFREPKHSKNAIYFQQSLLHLPENRGLTHQISADGSLVPRNFSLTNQLSWLAYRRGFFKLVSLFELNGKCLFRMKQQVELAENYSASASTWWHRVGYALTVETPNNSHLLRSGGLKISTQAAVDDATVKAARQLVRADFVAIDRASANATCDCCIGMSCRKAGAARRSCWMSEFSSYSVRFKQRLKSPAAASFVQNYRTGQLREPPCSLNFGRTPTTGASAGNFNFSGAINLSVGSLRLLAEQPNIRARQRLEISWPKLGSMRLDFERTSIDNRWGPDIHLAVEASFKWWTIDFPVKYQIGLDYRSSDVAEGYAATVRYVRYGHEFRADARGRGGVTFNGASNQLPLFNLTVEQALDLYGLEDAAPFSDIAKQLRLSARLIATRRGEVDLAWWLTSPVSAFGLEPVVGDGGAYSLVAAASAPWIGDAGRSLAPMFGGAPLPTVASALVSASLSGPSSNFVALYEHEFDEALTNLKARVHYQNNLLILTFEPQLLNASVAAVLAGSGETNLRGFIKTSWRSLQQLEFVATPAATYIDRIAHGESLRIFDARRISNRNFDPKGYIRRRDDWVLGIAFGVNSIEAFVANASVGLTSGGGIDDSDFELTLSGATAGMDLLSGRIYRQTSNGSSENPVISSGLRVICPAVTLNATEEATVGENGRKRWRLFLNDGGDVVTADVRFRGTRLDPDPTAQSSVIIRGTKYSVQQPDGPSSLRITASGFAPVDFNWSVQATSLARFRFRLNSQHRAKSSSETTVGTLDVEADWPSRIRAVFGRGANLASVKLGISTSSLSLIHSANGSFDGRVPLAPGLALRLPTPPGPVNLTAVWTPDDWLSNGLLNLDFWSSWRFRHRHRVVLSAAASEAQIETVSNSWRIFCNHSTASRTVQIFGSSNGFGDVDITQNSLKVSLADSADKLDMLYPNLFQFPWNNQDNVKSLKFAANLTAPTLSLLRPASLNIVRMVALDSQLKVRNVSLVCTYQADGGLQQADVTIAKAVTKSQGSKLIGTVMTKGFKLIQALHYEAEVNWKSANGEATAGVVCREQAKQLLAVQVSASKTGIAEFNAETSTNQSACRGRVVLPYLMKSRAPLLHFSMTDQVRIAFNASSDVKNWQFECYTMIRHFKVSRTTIDGVSKWHLTPDFRRTSGVVLSNSPSNGTTELRLPWRTIRLVQRRLTANLWELMLWPDAINRPFDANKLRCLTLLVALTRAIRLDLKASLLQEVSLKRLQIFASLITPDATSRMEAGADLPAKMERIGPVALRNGRMKILLGKSMSNDHRGGIAHQIEFELAPFQRFYFSIKDGPLLDLSFNQASGRLVWQLLTSRSGTGGNRTRSEKDSAAQEFWQLWMPQIPMLKLNGLLNRQHRIYWPTQVPALLFAVFNGTAAHAGALAVNSDSDSVKDARKIDLWFSESVPANVSFGFAGFHLSRNGSMELATSWPLRQALAEGSRVALTGSGDALQYELFAWQARPDSDVTLAASDLTAGWNFIRQISSRDEFYLKSVATPLLSRFGGLSNRTALERLALRWRHAVSGHLGRLRRAWMRLRELDQRPAEARQDYSEAEYDIYWLQNFLTPDDSFEYSTAAQVMQNSLASMGSEAAARLHGILFAHLADYKRLYDWLDDMGYEVRRLMSMKLDPLPELDSELLALARLWLRTKRRSDIFQRLTGLDSNQVLSWQPRCRADCSELGGTGVAQFRAQIRARVPRLRPAEWRRLAGRLARFARVAMDAIDVAIATPVHPGLQVGVLFEQAKLRRCLGVDAATSDDRCRRHPTASSGQRQSQLQSHAKLQAQSSTRVRRLMYTQGRWQEWHSADRRVAQQLLTTSQLLVKFAGSAQHHPRHREWLPDLHAARDRAVSEVAACQASESVKASLIELMALVPPSRFLAFLTIADQRGGLGIRLGLLHTAAASIQAGSRGAHGAELSSRPTTTRPSLLALSAAQLLTSSQASSCSRRSLQMPRELPGQSSRRTVVVESPARLGAGCGLRGRPA
uniref:VWFD domain-containing protein n=1 Tax=Macrostomum lignano TaxID=282301 RepID=A0A1I8GG65_9PLAT